MGSFCLSSNLSLTVYSIIQRDKKANLSDSQDATADPHIHPPLQTDPCLHSLQVNWQLPQGQNQHLHNHYITINAFLSPRNMIQKGAPVTNVSLEKLLLRTDCTLLDCSDEDTGSRNDPTNL